MNPRKSGATGLGLDAAEVLCLLLAGLETTVSELGGGVDELHLDLLEGGTAGLGQQGAAKGDGPLLGTGHRALGERMGGGAVASDKALSGWKTITV